MSKTSARVNFHEMQSLSSASVTGSYQIVGSAFTDPVILLKIVNSSDQAVTVSYEGTTDHDIVPANNFVVYDFNANAYNPLVGGNGMALKEGTGIYVKGTAGTGTIYVVGVCAG